MSKKFTFALVPETHWDREWYSPFQEFRIRLVRLTDKLLDILDNDPEYASFTFDGQTVVIETSGDSAGAAKDREGGKAERLFMDRGMFFRRVSGERGSYCPN